MSKSKSGRIDTSGGGEERGLVNPFAALSGEGLPPPPEAPLPVSAPAQPKSKPGRRFGIRRETAGRAGKVVTIVEPLDAISPPELNDLGRALRQSLGCGGTTRPGRIELQGELGEAAREWLRRAGQRVR